MLYAYVGGAHDKKLLKLAIGPFFVTKYLLR
jgi:hypothetical protein